MRRGIGCATNVGCTQQYFHPQTPTRPIKRCCQVQRSEKPRRTGRCESEWSQNRPRGRKHGWKESTLSAEVPVEVLKSWIVRTPRVSPLKSVAIPRKSLTPCERTTLPCRLRSYTSSGPAPDPVPAAKHRPAALAQSQQQAVSVDDDVIRLVDDDVIRLEARTPAAAACVISGRLVTLFEPRPSRTGGVCGHVP